jgi:hypothetical protein
VVDTGSRDAQTVAAELGQLLDRGEFMLNLLEVSSEGAA